MKEKCNHRDTETRSDETQRYHFADITEAVIGAAIEVHRALGPGLLESAYEMALCHELALRGLAFSRQVDLPVLYKGVNLGAEYRIDVLVEDAVVLELKSVDELTRVHEAQLLTYLRFSGKRIGLLLNFNVRHLKHGIRRLAL